MRKNAPFVSQEELEEERILLEIDQENLLERGLAAEDARAERIERANKALGESLATLVIFYNIPGIEDFLEQLIKEHGGKYFFPQLKYWSKRSSP